MFFRILNERKLNKEQSEAARNRGTDGVTYVNAKAMGYGDSPPPPYAEIFSRHASGGSMFGSSIDSGSGASRRMINGRDYMVVKERNGIGSQLIPIRAPSAAIFQYTYTN